MGSYVYFGPQFSSGATDGNFGSFTCLETGLGVDMEAIQEALDQGEEVQIRQPTWSEAESMQELLAFYRSTGAPATSLLQLRTYH